jgi:hypothetical protein
MSNLTPKFSDTPTSWVSPEGKVVEARNAKENTDYYQMGFQPASVNQIAKQERKNIYDNWLGAAASFGNGIIDGVPLLRSGITHLTSALQGADAARENALYQQDLSETNPLTHLAGALGGGAAVGAGAMAATGAALGMTGMAGQGLNVLQKTVQGVAVNVAMGAGYDVDRAALAHALEPGGEEKIWAHVAPNILANAALGAAFPLAGAGAKILGEWGESLANSQWQKSVTDSRAFANAVQLGRATELGSALDEYALYGKTPSQVRATIAQPLAEATEQMNTLKEQFANVRYSAKDTGNMADRIGTILGDSHPEKAQEAIQYLMETGNSPNLGELHTLRQMMSRGINFANATEETMAAQQPLVDAYKAVNENINSYFQKFATDPQSAEVWSQSNKAFGKLSLLDGALNKTDEMPVLADYIQGKKAPPWIVSYLGSALGMPWIGRISAAWNGASSMSQAFKDGALAGPANMLSKIFFKTSEMMDKALQLGLTQGVTAVRPKETDDFDMKASQMRHAMTDTGRTMGNTVATATQMGLPTDIAMGLGLKSQTAIQYLAANLPQTAPQAGMPSTMTASLQQKQKWLEIEHTIREPWHALENPTVDNLKAMQQFYPELLRQTQDEIHAQISTSVNMPLNAQIWASKVLGYPAGPLMRPGTYASLQAAKQMQAQKAQQAQMHGKAPQSNSSSPTQLEQQSSLNTGG